jgi:hypothetical protein
LNLDPYTYLLLNSDRNRDPAPVAEFLVSDRDKVDYDIGLAYRSAILWMETHHLTPQNFKFGLNCSNINYEI